MNKIFRLTKNELIKFFSKNSVLILAVILMVFVFGYALYVKTLPENISEDTWRVQLELQNKDMEYNLNSESVYMDDNIRQYNLRQIQANQYMLDNGIMPIKVHSISNFILKLNEMFFIVVIISIIAGVKLISSEYTEGTINNLLTLPVKRYKILISKFITLLIICFCVVAALYILASIIGGIFFGFSGFSNQVVSNFGNIEVHNCLLYSLNLNLYNFITLLACTSLTVMLTLFFKNGLISTCTGILLYYLGAFIALGFRDYGWMKYSLFANINFSEYFKGIPIVEGITPGFSVCVTSVYVLIFVAVSFLKFSRKYN